MSLELIEFKKILKRLDGKVLLAITFWPLIMSLLAISGSGFFVSKGPKLGAVDFIVTMIDFQDLIVLPLLVSVYICSMSFYEEIHTRQIYLYKDITRTKILNSKYKSVLYTYLLFYVLYAINALISYYLIFQFTKIGNGQIISYAENMIPSIFEAFEILLSQLFYIHIGISLSLRFNTGFSIFGSILLYLFIKTSRYIRWAKYLTPVGYREIINFGGHMDVITTLLISLAVWIAYNIIMYFFNKKYFNKLDFE